MSTLSLNHFEGADSTDVFTDEVGTISWAVQFGTPLIRTVQFKWGTSSGEIGSGDAIQGTGFVDTDLQGDLTIEGWFYRNGSSGSGIANVYDGTNNNRIQLAAASSATVAFLVVGGVTIFQLSGDPVLEDEWHHIAYVREGDTHSLYVDGVRVDTLTDSTTPASMTKSQIARSAGLGIYIDDFRISDTAVYSGATYDVPTGPFSIGPPPPENVYENFIPPALRNLTMQTVLNRLDPHRISAGLVPHVSFVEFIGSNPDIGTGTVPETLWAVGGVYNWRAAAATVFVVSDDAHDDGTPPNSGALAVTIEGLDADWLEISETITMNGLSEVESTKEFLRVNAAYVSSAGATGTNEGNITVSDTGGANPVAYIALGEGGSQTAVYSVPADAVLLLDGFYVTARDATGASSADISLRTRCNQSAAPAWKNAWVMVIDKVFSSPFNLPHPFPAKSDIELRATAVGANGTVSNWHGHGLLIRANADI